MKTIALITGASSGLGREYTRQLLKDTEIDEYWIIARRSVILEQMKQEMSQKLRPFPLDLTLSDSIRSLKQTLEEEQPFIKVLINAAGMGKIGQIREQKQKDTDRMIDLNCRAMADLTEISLPYMHKGSMILEISSVASFQPLPDFAAYAASKAFVTSYTKALHHELLTSGIHVTAVCPYWVKDTAFIPLAKSTKKKGYRHTPFASRSQNVVRTSLRDAKLNLWVSTPGILCTLDRVAAWLIPHFLYVPLMDLVSRL